MEVDSDLAKQFDIPGQRASNALIQSVSDPQESRVKPSAPSPFDDEPTRLTSRQDRLPNIRIIDLLVLTAAISFVFMFFEKSRRTGSYWGGMDHWFAYVHEFFWAFLMGTALAGWFWIANQKRLTGKFFKEPGHWLVGGQMVFALGILPSLLLNWIFGSPELSQDTWSTAIVFSSDALISFAVCVLLIFGVCSTKEMRWRLVLALASAESLFRGLDSLMTYLVFFRDDGAFARGRVPEELLGIVSGIAFVLLMLLAVVTIIVVLMDWAKKSKRDWLHWVGVCLILASSIIAPILLTIMSRILTQQFQ